MQTKGLLCGSIGLERAGHVFLTVGIIDLLRCGRQFPWLEAGSIKMALSHPAHQRVLHSGKPSTASQPFRAGAMTQAVGWAEGRRI